MRCVTVPEIVQPYLRQLMILHEALEAARHYGGPVLRAVLLGIDVMIVCEPNANPQELFGLLGSIPAQFSDNHNRQRNQTTPAALGFLLDYFPLPRPPLATTASCPLSRSTERQRKAITSPRRIPQRAHNRTGMNTGVPRAASIILAIVSVSIVFISLRGTFGGFTSTAGLYGMARHAHACVSACFSIVWIWWTVRGDSPPLPS